MGEKDKQLIDQIFNSNHSNEDKKESSRSENISVIVPEWLNPKHVKYKTRYTKNQITAISTFQSLATKYKIKTLQRFLNEYRIAKLSEDGASSEELKDILVSRMPEEEGKNTLEKLAKFLE